jgi:hypothetical protein
MPATLHRRREDTRFVERPIFVVGPGRSGTTLLRSLLSAHSRISIAPETHFMKRAENEGGLERGTPPDFEAFWDRYTSWVRFKDLDVDADRCRELMEMQGDHTFRTIFRAVLTAFRERVGKERVGEKTPSHIFFLSHLLRWFPKARVLILQRDPRAVIASQLKSPWVADRLTPRSLQDGVFLGKRHNHLLFYADKWVRIYNEIVPAWADDPRVLVVRYEALVQDPESEMRRVCDFLGEVYEPRMLTSRSSATVPLPSGTAKPRLEQWRREHQAQSLQPVSAGSLEKWKQGLSRSEIAMIEARCSRGMPEVGYTFELPAPERSAGWALAHILHTIGRAEGQTRGLASAIRSRLR